MQLRKSKILKILAIILFSFELLAPSVFAFTRINECRREKDERSTISQSHVAGGLSVFTFFEEFAEEELEEKNDTPLAISFFYANYSFHSPILSDGSNISLAKTKQISETHPPLFKLYRVFII
jgi:hypothetical protein